MKARLFLTILVMVVIVFAGVNPATAQAEHKVFLPIVVRPFFPPQCVVIVTNGQQPNDVTFGINCQNVIDSWVHLKFDTLGHDSASTDALLVAGVGFSEHAYPWPYTQFAARLTVVGLDSKEYQFDIPVQVNWP